MKPRLALTLRKPSYHHAACLLVSPYISTETSPEFSLRIPLRFSPRIQQFLKKCPRNFYRNSMIPSSREFQDSSIFFFNIIRQGNLRNSFIVSFKIFRYFFRNNSSDSFCVSNFLCFKSFPWIFIFIIFRFKKPVGILLRASHGIL